MLHTVAEQHLHVLGGHRQPRTWAATRDTRGGSDATRRAWGAVGTGGMRGERLRAYNEKTLQYNSETQKTRLKFLSRVLTLTSDIEMKQTLFVASRSCHRQTKARRTFVNPTSNL